MVEGSLGNLVIRYGILANHEPFTLTVGQEIVIDIKLGRPDGTV